MLIDGEKLACEACVRGHRVSNCQHAVVSAAVLPGMIYRPRAVDQQLANHLASSLAANRPLQHINKKGRPISQCGHCRAMRKSKSSHVKCDCGEKTHKCIHLQGVVEGHKGSCCCNHGGRCTCSHKKEQPSLDPVPESDSDQEVSIPTKSSCAKNPLARRRRAKESGSTIDSFISSHILHGKRRVKSEAASPMMNSNAFSQLNGQLPPLDLSSIEYPSYIAGGFDLFNNLSDHEAGLFSADLSATSVDWSHYDLDFSANKTGDNFAPSSYSQPPSFAGFDFNGSEQAPTLTTNTSDDVSEVEDFLGPSLDDFDASGAFGASTAPNTFSVGGPQTGLFNSNDLGPLDYDDLKIMMVGSKLLPTPASLAGDEPSLGVTSAGASGFSFVEDDPALWVSDYSGLPAMADNTETGMLPLWDQQ